MMHKVYENPTANGGVSVLTAETGTIYAVLITDDPDVFRLMDEVEHSHDYLNVPSDTRVGALRVYTIVGMEDTMTPGGPDDAFEIMSEELESWLEAL